MPLLVGALLMIVLTYMSYTVVHDAVHGSISGSHQKLRWVNEGMGYLTAWIMAIPLTAHRFEHLTHHRNTNDPDGDPEFVVSDMTRSPFHAVRAAVGIAMPLRKPSWPLCRALLLGASFVAATIIRRPLHVDPQNLST